MSAVPLVVVGADLLGLAQDEHGGVQLTVSGVLARGSEDRWVTTVLTGTEARVVVSVSTSVVGRGELDSEQLVVVLPGRWVSAEDCGVGGGRTSEDPEAVMGLDEVEDVVVEAAGALGLLAESSRDGRRVDVILRGSPPGGSGSAARRARISTSGVEAFFLDVPGGFGHQEFDHERGGQVEILHLLVALAGEHLSGRVREGEEVRFLGRRRRYLEVTTGDEQYRLHRR